MPNNKSLKTPMNFLKKLKNLKILKKLKKPSKKKISLGIGLIIVLVVLYLFKSLFVAAFVNGKPLSRISVIAELEKQYGKQALDSLVSKMLIYQEAKKQKIEVTEKEVDNLITEIEKAYESQGGIDQVLLLQGMTRNDLKKQIETQLLIEKILAEKALVTTKEVNEYIETNKEALPGDLSSEEIEKSVEGQLRQQKISEEFQIWLTDVQQKAKINYFVEY